MQHTTIGKYQYELVHKFLLQGHVTCSQRCVETVTIVVSVMVLCVDLQAYAQCLILTEMEWEMIVIIVHLCSILIKTLPSVH